VPGASTGHGTASFVPPENPKARFEGLQDLFGLGRWGTGFNLIVGPAEFWVRADDADHARERLEGLGAPSLEGTVPSDDNG
jgi:hypothetical protein